MNTSDKMEGLILNLPDYISNNISDINLKSQIETELKINPVFKNEHDELVKTFSFLNSSELESPSENYFNNLPVKINERISAGENSGKSTIASYLDRLSTLWKILIPAIPVIIIAVVLMNRPDTNESNISKENVQTEITKDMTAEENKNSTENKTEELKTESNNNNSNSEVQLPGSGITQTHSPDIRLKKNKTNPGNIKGKINLNQTENQFASSTQESLNNLISENTEATEEETAESDEDVFYTGDNTEEDLEDEFFDMPQDQQQEIINNLKKTQI